ncbi:MAG TPA: AmmeMemoRadiSam system protein A [Dehalococcoidia bacterium]|nr:AmmeMemoRadiSam system protein A [Dehalococcoidia bacterium]
MAQNEIHPLVQLAKRTVEKFVRERQVLKAKDLTPEMRERAGVFVSLKKAGDLRGCIGTFEPTRSNVAEEIIHNAIQSATQDPRFEEVRPDELDSLEYSVDILTPPQPVKDIQQLDAKKQGIIVQSGWKRGLLLPDLEGVDSVQRQIEICMLKAGIRQGEPIELMSFEVRRYK